MQQYRQKSQLIYDLLSSMSTKRMMLNQMCTLVNLDNGRLHRYLDALVSRGLVEKYKLLGIYEDKLYEYQLTEDGHHVLKMLREYNEMFEWIFMI